MPCDPEFPPLLMISGTNKATIGSNSISCSKTPIAVAVSISPRNSADSQPPLFFTIGQNSISMYGASRASMPPIFCISSVAFCSATSSTSSTVMIPSMSPPASVTGSATRSYRSKAASTSFLVDVA